jgi:putative two-component system response regulator
MMETLRRADILVVDDTPANLLVLSEILGQEYNVRPAPNGRLALKAAEHMPPDIVLLDITMPEMTGYEVCEHLKANPLLAAIPVIFISALSDATEKVKGFQVGGVDYITKPFQIEEVQARIRTHLKLRQFQFELEQHNLHLEEMVQNQVREILAVNKRLQDAQMATILAMSKVAEGRDDDTGKHIERVQHYSRSLALGLRKRSEYQDIIDDGFIENLFHATPLHDIGKVSTPDAILLKPGPLDDNEFAIMQRHAPQGARILLSVHERYPDNEFIKMGMVIARSHHEKWNGAGYPDKLAGPDIPLVARIIALADVYDALRTKRCYKPAFSREKSNHIITVGIGQHFDPEVGAVYLEMEPEFDSICEGMRD